MFGFHLISIIILVVAVFALLFWHRGNTSEIGTDAPRQKAFMVMFIILLIALLYFDMGGIDGMDGMMQ